MKKQLKLSSVTADETINLYDQIRDLFNAKGSFVITEIQPIGIDFNTVNSEVEKHIPEIGKKSIFRDIFKLNKTDTFNYNNITIEANPLHFNIIIQTLDHGGK